MVALKHLYAPTFKVWHFWDGAHFVLFLSELPHLTSTFTRRSLKAIRVCGIGGCQTRPP